MDNDNISKEEIDYISDIEQTIHERSSRAASMFVMVVLIFFISLITWAHFSEIDEQTRATAKVIPSSKVKKIQSLEGGIVEEVFVKNGALVEKGQLLLRIDDTNFGSSLKEQQSQYYGLLGKIARLTAEVNGKSKIIWPDEIKNNTKLIKLETEHYQSRKRTFNASYHSLERRYVLLNEELRMTMPLVKTGAISKVELLQLQRQVIQIKSEMEEYRHSFIEEAQDELNDATTKANALKEAIVAKKDMVERTIIRSPVNGKVKAIHVNTDGQVVSPGSDIMEIVPIDDTLLIEAEVAPHDIGFIAPNQRAMVKITAYDFAIYGGLEGRVEHISADTIMNAEGDEFYVVLVRTKKNYLKAKNGRKLPIMPGMTASVSILTGKKSILSYILKPILKTKQNALSER